jgi:hypothetical protein
VGKTRRRLRSTIGQDAVYAYCARERFCPPHSIIRTETQKQAIRVKLPHEGRAQVNAREEIMLTRRDALIGAMCVGGIILQRKEGIRRVLMSL